MQSEDLFISAKEIRVRYHFYNNSSSDIVTQVAFPMPDMHMGWTMTSQFLRQTPKIFSALKPPLMVDR